MLTRMKERMKDKIEISVIIVIVLLVFQYFSRNFPLYKAASSHLEGHLFTSQLPSSDGIFSHRLKYTIGLDHNRENRLVYFYESVFSLLWFLNGRLTTLTESFRETNACNRLLSIPNIGKRYLCKSSHQINLVIEAGVLSFRITIFQTTSPFE